MDTAEWIMWALGVQATVLIAYAGYIQKRFAALQTAEDNRHSLERSENVASREKIWHRLNQQDKDFDHFKDRMLSTMVTKDDLQALHAQWKDDMRAMEGRLMSAMQSNRVT